MLYRYGIDVWHKDKLHNQIGYKSTEEYMFPKNENGYITINWIEYILIYQRKIIKANNIAFENNISSTKQD